MTETPKEKKKTGFSFDWLVGGILSKFGETVDRVTGRGWNPSSSLATSKLSEKVKFLLDEEAKDHNGGKYAPHVLTLKIQWNKFSADAEEDLEKLEDELHAAAIDHINDKLYHTFAPLNIDIKTDYFTEGVRLIGSFGEFGEENEEAAMNVTLPNVTIDDLSDATRASIYLEGGPPSQLPEFTISFEAKGKTWDYKLDFDNHKRYSVGRAKDNDITVDHASVSKVHASLVLKDDSRLVIADTGSTNGTFISGERIVYGKAIELTEGVDLKLGSVRISVTEAKRPVVTEVLPESALPDNALPVTQVGEQVEEPVAVEPLNVSEVGQNVSPPVIEPTQQSIESATDDWAMTSDKPLAEDSGPVSPNENEGVRATQPHGKLENSGGSEAPKIAEQPVADSVVIKPDSKLRAKETDSENWGEFANAPVSANTGEEILKESVNDSEDWSSFAGEVDSEKTGAGDVEEEESDKEDWEV